MPLPVAWQPNFAFPCCHSWQLEFFPAFTRWGNDTYEYSVGNLNISSPVSCLTKFLTPKIMAFSDCKLPGSVTWARKTKYRSAEFTRLLTQNENVQPFFRGHFLGSWIEVLGGFSLLRRSAETGGHRQYRALCTLWRSMASEWHSRSTHWELYIILAQWKFGCEQRFSCSW